MKNIIFISLFTSMCLISCQEQKRTTISYIPFNSIEVGGELKTRVHQNFNRLEEEKYQPHKVFLTEKQSGSWPGDTEGRTILGLVMDAQASKREPLYLQQIIDKLPSKLNEKGYMGKIYEGKMNEQQLSGNGWMLRGLCEYYAWKKDPVVLKYIRSIAMNLFVAGKGYYAQYPIDPNLRDKKVGGESGTTQVKGTDKWILSSDIGCLFIGMEGAIHAYKYLQDPALKAVIEEMLAKFKDMDILKINAQTHATLTACRGLLRYADIIGDDSYVKWAEDIWNIYKNHGMTEAHGNYNWFNRYDTWTEPCAIVDSYMLAVQLWMHTENPIYKEDAELIYYNAIAHAQRQNGGFGTDNCPGEAIHSENLAPRTYEAHWCCTMRGGEGLGSAVRYSAFIKGDTLYIPFLRDSKLSLMKDNKQLLSLVEKTKYPFDTQAEFEIVAATNEIDNIKLPVATWMSDVKVTYNGLEKSYPQNKGFITISEPFKQGDKIKLLFNHPLRKVATINKENTANSQFKYYYGPLLLGVDNSITSENMESKLVFDGPQGTKLTPVYHLMDSKIQNVPKDKNTYHIQILFE